MLRQRKRLSRKPETWRYFWDSEDRLVEVLTPDGTRWRYRYDPLGRRVAKQRLTPDGSGVAEQIEFTWDGTVLAEQAHTDGALNGPQLGDRRVTVWDYEPGTFRPLIQAERSPLRNAPQQWVDEQFYSIVTDLVGTPTELVNDQGGIAWFHRTTLWGVTTDQSRTGAYTPLRFPGQYADPETGFNYNYERHYDPTTSRYASSDPLGLEAGSRNYGYVENPYEAIDPLGLMTCHTVKSRLREAGPGTEFGLPNQGRIRYVTPHGYNPVNPLPRGPQKGYIDRFGNEWVAGPSRTQGHPFEWDVQLSRAGQAQIGWLSRENGRNAHVNVSPLGEVTHR